MSQRRISSGLNIPLAAFADLPASSGLKAANGRVLFGQVDPLDPPTLRSPTALLYVRAGALRKEGQVRVGLALKAKDGVWGGGGAERGGWHECVHLRVCVSVCAEVGVLLIYKAHAEGQRT